MECGKQNEDCHHAKSAADEAADAAVKKVFAVLGVDINDPRQVEDFRKDLRFGASLRRASDRGVIVFVSAVASALAYVLWVGFTNTIGRH